MARSCFRDVPSFKVQSTGVAQSSAAGDLSARTDNARGQQEAGRRALLAAAAAIPTGQLVVDDGTPVRFDAAESAAVHRTPAGDQHGGQTTPAFGVGAYLCESVPGACRAS